MAVAAALLLAGCDSGSSPAPTRTPTTPGATTASAAAPSPAEDLARLARLGVSVSYRARYVATQRHPRSRAGWQVWRSRTSLRVDVETRHSKATLIVTPRAAYACRAAAHERTCFRVAKGGKPIPAPFQLLAERLFDSDLGRLAAHADSYRVRSAARVGAASASCFGVRARGDAPRPRVSRGTYCFSDRGLLSAVVYPSGNKVLLQHASTKAPDRGTFKPYAHPTPLPG